LITVFRLTQFDEIQEAQWNDLLSKNEVNEIFLTYQWVHSWWTCCAANRELFLLIAIKADQVVSIAPLMLSFKRLGVFRYSVLEFIGCRQSDYCDFIVPTEHKRDVLDAMFDFLETQSHLWDAIFLNKIPEHSSTISYLRRLKAAYPLYQVKDDLSHLCPTLLIQNDPEFVQSCLKKKSLKRSFNYFDKNGTLEHKTAQSPAEVYAELESLFQQHIDRWLVAGSRSIFHDERIRAFYRCLVDSLMPEGWLKFSTIRFNGEPIAYHFGFEYNGKFIWYKPTFNIDYSRKSPGQVLIKYLLEDCIQSGMSELDFTVGDEFFKRRFANEIRKNFKIEIWSNKPLWMLSSFANSSKQRFKRKLPKVFAFLKRYFESIQLNS
jgi:CelD/BcsL family acetyltransferase involved in cellulose biosynthesis